VGNSYSVWKRPPHHLDFADGLELRESLPANSMNT